MSQVVTSRHIPVLERENKLLEFYGFYRKCTAPDASSLFRVISELLYDTQMLYEEIRRECVDFINLKRRVFEKYVPGDFDEYTKKMYRSTSNGTMLELRAMCIMYKRNALLFESFKKGVPVVFDTRFKHTFNIFYYPNNHFDSVFKLDDVTTAGICQAIAYKLLYKSTFKLPDIDYAVECMLQPQRFLGHGHKMEFDDHGYTSRMLCRDGRIFLFDMPYNTRCILADYKECNFHYQQRQLVTCEWSAPKYRLTRGLTNVYPKAISCIRQLLANNLKPFFICVAQSLSPDCYRNTELATWRFTTKGPTLYKAGNWQDVERFHGRYKNQRFAKTGVRIQEQRVFYQNPMHNMPQHLYQDANRQTAQSIPRHNYFKPASCVPRQPLLPLPRCANDSDASTSSSQESANSIVAAHYAGSCIPVHGSGRLGYLQQTNGHFGNYQINH